MLGLASSEGLGVTVLRRGDSMHGVYAFAQSLSRQTYDILAVAGKKPGAAGNPHFFRVSSASASSSLCPGLSPLVPMIAIRVTFPSAFTSNSSVVVPVAPLRRASAGYGGCEQALAPTATVRRCVGTGVVQAATTPAMSKATNGFVLGYLGNMFTVKGERKAASVTPNVRAEAGPTAKRQARAVENAPARRAGLAF